MIGGNQVRIATLLCGILVIVMPEVLGLGFGDSLSPSVFLAMLIGSLACALVIYE